MAATSTRRGSPCDPGSLHRSKTQTRCTVGGMAARKRLWSHGLKRRTFRTPTFIPFSFTRYFAVSLHVTAPLPMTTMISVASGWPSYA